MALHSTQNHARGHGHLGLVHGDESWVGRPDMGLRSRSCLQVAQTGKRVHPTVTHLGDASHWLLFRLVRLDMQASAAWFIWRKRTAIGFEDHSSVVGSRQRERATGESDNDGTSPLRFAWARSVLRTSYIVQICTDHAGAFLVSKCVG